MQKRRSTIPKIMIFGLLAFASSACVTAYVSEPCTPLTPGAESMKIVFVCPYVGASYETEALKCPGDDHFRVDVYCKLCGRRHAYNINYWPDDYGPDMYIFYWGWFYPHTYWNQWWSYGHRHHLVRPPMIHPRPLPHPRRYFDRRHDRPGTVRPPALPAPPRAERPRGQPRPVAPPPPPPQQGNQRPLRRHSRQ